MHCDDTRFSRYLSDMGALTFKVADDALEVIVARAVLPFARVHDVFSTALHLVLPVVAPHDKKLGDLVVILRLEPATHGVGEHGDDTIPQHPSLSGAPTVPPQPPMPARAFQSPSGPSHARPHKTAAPIGSDEAKRSPVRRPLRERHAQSDTGTGIVHDVHVRSPVAPARAPTSTAMAAALPTNDVLSTLISRGERLRDEMAIASHVSSHPSGVENAGAGGPALSMSNRASMPAAQRSVPSTADPVLDLLLAPRAEDVPNLGSQEAADMMGEAAWLDGSLDSAGVLDDERLLGELFYRDANSDVSRSTETLSSGGADEDDMQESVAMAGVKRRGRPEAPRTGPSQKMQGL